MYYSQGIKNVDKTLDAKAKEKLLFEEEPEAKEVYSNNLQDILRTTFETRKNQSINLDNYDVGAHQTSNQKEED